MILPQKYLTTNFKLRFIAKTSSVYEDIQIDDVLVEGLTAGVNIPPVAIAGPDQTVFEGDIITLDGSDSNDEDDGIATYKWEQISGPPVTLNGTEDSSSLTFPAPDVGPSGASLLFELTVTDSGGLKSTDTCIINVMWVNIPPAAVTGEDQKVNTGDLVVLDASESSDPDDGIAFYRWYQTSGRRGFLCGLVDLYGLFANGALVLYKSIFQRK